MRSEALRPVATLQVGTRKPATEKTAARRLVAPEPVETEQPQSRAIGSRAAAPRTPMERSRQAAMFADWPKVADPTAAMVGMEATAVRPIPEQMHPVALQGQVVTPPADLPSI